MKSRSPTYALPLYARLIWILLNFALGIIPSALFFIWVERNTALPFIAVELQWPWITFASTSLVLLLPCAINLLLILGFGVIHTAFAQPGATRALERLFPPQTIRTLYMMITGASVILVMGFWQHTGIILWNVPLPGQHLTMALSIALYLGFMSVVVRQAARFDLWQFVGLRQLHSYARDVQGRVSNPRLITTGYFRFVRHPVYTFTLCAFAVTPMMSLDRLIVLTGSLLYLMVGIPIEEKKLFTTFGEDYKRYQTQVPALFPKWSRSPEQRTKN